MLPAIVSSCVLNESIQINSIQPISLYISITYSNAQPRLLKRVSPDHNLTLALKGFNHQHIATNCQSPEYCKIYYHINQLISSFPGYTFCICDFLFFPERVILNSKNILYKDFKFSFVLCRFLVLRLLLWSV